jgi:FAD/FMN-containing dehydrogenase
MDIPGFRGRVVTQDDADYGDVRKIWNGAIDRRPAVIARCGGTADVVAALRFARERDLLVSVRGGGHGVNGAALNDDGIVIDTALMRGVHVDAQRKTARAQSGVLWGDFDHETQAFGLATTGGVVTHTGIAGLTLGGGIGWLMRKHGTTADNFVRADLVTADGEVLDVSDDTNAELMWGLRGAGANFGIVTSFEYRLHEVGPTVVAGPVVWAMEDAPEVLRFYREFCASAPDELTTIVTLRKLAPLPIFPEEHHGRRVCIVSVCWAGDLEAGERAVAPLMAFGSPLFHRVARKPYMVNQAANDPVVPHGWHYYWKSRNLPELKDDLVDIIVEHSLEIASPKSYSIIFQLGGAVGRVPEDATAYSHRDAAHNININGVWAPDEPIGDHEASWVRGLFDALEPHEAGVYANFLMDEGHDRVRAAYGDAKFERLMALKDRYDPSNVFRMNQNVPPSPR